MGRIKETWKETRCKSISACELIKGIDCWVEIGSSFVVSQRPNQRNETVVVRGNFSIWTSSSGICAIVDYAPVFAVPRIYVAISGLLLNSQHFFFQIRSLFCSFSTCVAFES